MSRNLLEEERKSRKSLEREITKLKEQLKSARKNRFGSKKQSVKKDDSGSDDDPVDREKEKDGFDGTDESLDTRSVAESETQESHPSSPNPGDLCNRPETYRTMGVNGTPVRHLSDLSKVPGRILDRKMVKTFRLGHLPCGGTVRDGAVRGEGPQAALGVFPQGRTPAGGNSV